MNYLLIKDTILEKMLLHNNVVNSYYKTRKIFSTLIPALSKQSKDDIFLYCDKKYFDIKNVSSKRELLLEENIDVKNMFRKANHLKQGLVHRPSLFMSERFFKDNIFSEIITNVESYFTQCINRMDNNDIARNFYDVKVIFSSTPCSVSIDFSNAINEAVRKNKLHISSPDLRHLRENFDYFYTADMKRSQYYVILRVNDHDFKKLKLTSLWTDYLQPVTYPISQTRVEQVIKTDPHHKEFDIVEYQFNKILGE